MDKLYDQLLSEVPEDATEEFLKQKNLFYVFFRVVTTTPRESSILVYKKFRRTDQKESS